MLALELFAGLSDHASLALDRSTSFGVSDESLLYRHAGRNFIVGVPEEVFFVGEDSRVETFVE